MSQDTGRLDFVAVRASKREKEFLLALPEGYLDTVAPIPHSDRLNATAPKRREYRGTVRQRERAGGPEATRPFPACSESVA